MSEPKDGAVLLEADDILKRVLAVKSIPLANISVDSLYMAAESQHLQGLYEYAMFLVSGRLFDQVLQEDLSQVSDAELDTKITLLQQISSSFLVSIQEDFLLELLRPIFTAQYDGALLTIYEQMNEKFLRHQALIQAEIESRRAREAKLPRGGSFWPANISRASSRFPLGLHLILPVLYPSRPAGWVIYTGPLYSRLCLSDVRPPGLSGQPPGPPAPLFFVAARLFDVLPLLPELPAQLRVAAARPLDEVT